MKSPKYGCADCASCGKRLYFKNRNVWSNTLGWLSVVAVERRMPTNESQNYGYKSQLKEQQDIVGCSLFFVIVPIVFAIIYVIFQSIF